MTMTYIQDYNLSSPPKIWEGPHQQHHRNIPCNFYLAHHEPISMWCVHGSLFSWFISVETIQPGRSSFEAEVSSVNWNLRSGGSQVQKWSQQPCKKTSYDRSIRPSIHASIHPSIHPSNLSNLICLSIYLFFLFYACFWHYSMYELQQHPLSKSSLLLPNCGPRWLQR